MKLKWEIDNSVYNTYKTIVSQQIFKSMQLYFSIATVEKNEYYAYLEDCDYRVWGGKFKTLKAAKAGCENLLNEIKEELSK